jgi:hypothetical protein
VQDMEKRRLKDLFVNNYRFQGVAEKIPETPQTVLTNRSKIRVRSEKELGWIWLRRNLMDLGGFLQDCKTRKDL